MNADQAGRGFALAWLCSLLGIIFAGLLVYSQTQAYSWDEGFHLLAAALIQSGKRPYLDFCFPQTPLNAYFYSGWMRLFGESWRVTHMVASALTTAAVFLAADYVLSRFPTREWRLAGAITVALLIGLNDTVVFFGTIAQAYALCLFLTVAAFRVAILAAARAPAWLAALAGLLVSASAASSLLTAPTVPVMLVWILFANRAGSRFTKFAAFIGGAIIPFLPVLWLFVHSPHVVFFNIAGYQLSGRRARWEGATGHDLDALTSWVDSGPALFLGLLAIAGLFFVERKMNWPQAVRREYYLCAWLAGGMAIEIAAAHPTFSWYFVLTVPFLAILAVAGLEEIATRVYRPNRPLWPVSLLAIILVLGFGRALHDDLDEMNWQTMQTIAQKVLEVTPPGGSIWAGEQFFFLTHRTPPDGMEFQASQRLEIPRSEAEPLHILPAQELAQRVKSGAYDTIENCDDKRISELGLADLYAKSQDIEACTIFWDKKK